MASTTGRRDFSGTFTSPNGLYKLIVDDTTARMEGPTGRVRITSGIELQVRSAANAVSDRRRRATLSSLRSGDHRIGGTPDLPERGRVD